MKISFNFWGKNASPLVGLLITLVLSLFLVIKPHLLDPLENKLLDYRFKLRGGLKPPENIIIAGIDEKSLEKLGRWPWSREILAKLVDRLNQAGAELVVFDIIFSEPEKNDQTLAASLNQAGNVILPIVFEFEKRAPQRGADLSNFALKNIENPQAFLRYAPIEGAGILYPVEKLLEQAMGIGHINMFPDSDGVLRWEALLIAHEGYLYPALTLKVSSLLLGLPEEKIVVKATQGIWLGKRFLPTDEWGRMLINYYGPNYTFKHLSLVDILEGKIPPQQLEGKVVLIGATAVGIYDLRVTPFSPAMPGVEKHASVIASIVENNLLKKAKDYENFLFNLLSGLALILVLWKIKGLLGGIFTLFILLAILGFGQYTFVLHNLWLNLAFPLTNTILVFTSITLLNYAREERQAKMIKSMFSSYVTEKVVNELIKNPNLLKLGGQRKEVSVLFSDIRGFTSFSEKHSPEEVVSLLNEYLSAMTEVVFRWDGTLDKFIGDAILAFWGAPLEQANHAELAVRCAVDMVRRLKELQEKWRREGKPILDCGIGINSGEVVVGNIGALGKKMDYTVIGDHVNLGSRVEGLTRKYNAHILITEFTLENLKEPIQQGKFREVEFQEIDRVQVKGKEKPVTIYEVKLKES